MKSYQKNLKLSGIKDYQRFDFPAKFQQQITFVEPSPKITKSLLKQCTKLSAAILFFSVRAPRMLFFDETWQEPQTYDKVWCSKISDFLDFVLYFFQVYCSCGCTYTREQPHLSLARLSTCNLYNSVTELVWYNLNPYIIFSGDHEGSTHCCRWIHIWRWRHKGLVSNGEQNFPHGLRQLRTPWVDTKQCPSFCNSRMAKATTTMTF